MVIQNKHTPSVKRTLTKERWEGMPEKYKKLFDIIDPNDTETKEMIVSPTFKDKHTKKTITKGIVPPPTGEKSSTKKKKKKGADDTNEES